MNEVIRQLHERKSVRAFTDQTIDAAVKKEILYAACAAPTAGNQQMYTILDITDRELIQKLSVTCDNQPFIADAQLVLIFCADFKKWYDLFLSQGCVPRKPAMGDFMLAVQDAVIAAQNAVTAAHSFGLGSCYIGDIMENCEQHREMLQLPQYVFPAAMVVFGYPTQQQIEREKPKRCDLSYVVHENAYHTMKSDTLCEMFDYKKGVLPFDEWCTRFCERKYNSDFSVEMSRSVSLYMKDYLTEENAQ
ncbi:MAG: nitroreductase family protein [Clostridia bacterium]|nr:nitroreductase family protein [Clostridia bacterium]